MTTTCENTQIFSGCFTSSFINNNNNFNFPANFKPPTSKFGAKSTSTLKLTCAVPPNSGDHVNVESCGRRRLLVLSATVPFLIHMQEYAEDFCVEAEELETNEDQIIRDEVRKVLSKGKAAGVLRLVFHDAGTFDSNSNTDVDTALPKWHRLGTHYGDVDTALCGMNGSVSYELERPENTGLKKSLKILEKAKNQLVASKSVSWADLIAVAGAEAVSICGGPAIPVRLGRLDSLTPDPEGNMPEESLDAPRLKQCFKRKGFSTQELVALSGAHTIGSKGFGSPTVFDNSYYKILLEKPWASAAGMTSMVGLPSDRALVEDDECLRWITEYANDEVVFFEDFKNAYIKLVNCGAKWKAS